MPQATAAIYEFWQLLAEHVFPGVSPEADIMVLSLGSPFEAWWTHGLEAMAQADGLTTVASIGNGPNASDPVLYPGAGPNVIGVGVVDGEPTPGDSMLARDDYVVYLAHSSAGPTTDGRCKPDLVAPGRCLIACANHHSDYEVNGSWSSYAGHGGQGAPRVTAWPGAFRVPCLLPCR